MRLYDFHCASCGKDFEDLVRDVTDAKCPACNSTTVEKVLSGFAVTGTKGEEAPCNVVACGRGACGSGGCGMN